MSYNISVEVIDRNRSVQFESELSVTKGGHQVLPHMSRLEAPNRIKRGKVKTPAKLTGLPWIAAFSLQAQLLGFSTQSLTTPAKYSIVT